MDLKQAALECAAQGLAVFPLLPRDKKPAIREWQKQATTDAKQISAWWDQNPAYNIGIAAGSPSGGLVVLDLDCDEKTGKNGIARLQRWQEETHTRLPPVTAEARTGRGGLHIFFRDPVGEYKNAVDLLKDGSGIDVRATGGYIVAPGSVHPNGNTYKWVKPPVIYGIAPVDSSVKLLLQGFGQDPAAPFSLPDSIGEGERNYRLFRLACSLRGKGLSEEAIRSAVHIENDEKCCPPLPSEELDAIIASALKYKPGEAPRPGKAPPAAANQSTELLTLADVEEKEPEWLIGGYIPRGEISILAGDGGAGKTSAWCALAAAVSFGGRSFLESAIPDPVPVRAPGTVLYFSSEDSNEYVLRKRLRQNGADLNRIKTLDSADDRFQLLTLNGDFLERLVAAHRPALCVFDPLQAFIGGANMVSRAEMRECLKRLHPIGEKYGTAFLIIMHTNKQQGVWGRNRLSDSSDIWDISRSVMIVGNTPQEGIRYISHEKSNYGPLGETVLFSIDGESTVIRRGSSPKKDREYVAEAARIARAAPAAEEAKAFILDYLNDEGGSCTVGDLDEAAEAFGISRHTLQKAKSSLENAGKITRTREANGQGKGQKWLISRCAERN